MIDFESGELKEEFNSTQTIETERPEVKSIPIILPILDSFRNLIKSKNINDFKKRINTMTSTCNDCHKINHFKFNVIKIPDKEPVVNQEFKPIK